MSDAFLSLRGVAKSFPGHVAVDGVDLDIGRGEFVTLLGPSGCGKTTLLRMIAGFETPSDGRITLDGADLLRLAPERRPLNMVFQSYALFPHLNVFDNVAYGLRTAGTREDAVRARVAEALELVGLERVADRRVDQLSGGMSQRVALVRALVNEPAVLLLDEPLGALDLKLRQRMQVELRSLQQRTGTTFVYVTHDQEEALVLSHRVVVMRDGRIVQVGSPAEVYRAPRTRFVAEFLGDASLVRVDVESIGDGRGRVRIGDVVLDVLCDADPPPSVPGAGLLVLRPEDLRLSGTDAGVLTGRVADSIFLGSTTHVLVDLASGERVRVATDGTDRPARGAPVGVAVRAGGGVLVAEETPAVDVVEDLEDAASPATAT